MTEQTADPPPRGTEHRRGMRFSVIVPVEVTWQEPGGKTLIEVAQARDVNAQGGLLDMKLYPWVGGDLELTNLLSGDSAKRVWLVHVVQRMLLFLGLPSRLWFRARLSGV